MILRLLFLYALLCNVFTSFSQDLSLSSLTIPDSLRQNANSVVRYEKTTIEIPERRTLNLKYHRVTTILNKEGNGHSNAYLYYDPKEKVKSLNAVVYNNLGIEIEKFKKRDFKDVSPGDGISIFNDTRLLYLDYTPTSYPYTIEISYETETSTTAHIKPWYPLGSTYSSAEESIYEIKVNPVLEFKYKEFNIDNESIKVTYNPNGTFRAEAKSVPAVRLEYLGGSFNDIVPRIIFGINKFHLEGVDGEGKDWEQFGKWMHTILLKDVAVIPDEVIQEVRQLVTGASDDREKARIVYEYMQDRTRYVSIQMGIGGWKPTPASDVHNLGYGDCKGLSNYTKSLLAAVDVPSNYAIIYGDRDIRDIDEDFASIQGNHAILSVPYDGDYIWLECTDQEVPFGHIAGFTDDRNALIVSENGGKIVETKRYTSAENKMYSDADITLDESGDMSASLIIKATGSQYDYLKRIVSSNEDEAIDNLKSYYDYVHSLSVNDLTYEAHKNTDEYEVRTTLESKKYVKKINDEYIFEPNFFARNTSIPRKYRERKLSLHIDRGYQNVSSFQVHIPEVFQIEFLPDPVLVETEFGSYTSEVNKIEGENTLVFTREFILNKGTYTSDKYKLYRAFRKQVARYDNQKIILKK